MGIIRLKNHGSESWFKLEKHIRAKDTREKEDYMKYAIEIVVVRNNEEYSIGKIECKNLDMAEQLFKMINPTHLNGNQVGVLLKEDKEETDFKYSKK